MLESIINDAVEVFNDEYKQGYIETLEDVRTFGRESADIYISKLSVKDEWSLIEELNQTEPVAEFGLGEEKTLGQAITTYVESTLAELIVRATIKEYYERWAN